MRKARSKRFKGWDKVKIVDDHGIEKEAIAPVILSASWRTDIPAWHSDWLISRLRRGHMLSTHRQQKYVSFDKTRVIVLWTKNPTQMFKYLKELDQMGIGYYFHYTLTDYDHEDLEPNLPPLEDRIEAFKELSKRIGKEKVIWRFDPLVLAGNIDRDRLIEKVGRLMERLTGYTEKLVFSFLDPTCRKKVERKLIKSGINSYAFSAEDMAYVAFHIANLAKDRGIQVAACAEAMDLSPFSVCRNKCIGDEYLRRVFGHDEQLMTFLDIVAGMKNAGQRKLCGCIPSFDIGTYDTCKHGCVYCYANNSNNAVAKNFNRLSLDGESLLLPVQAI